MRDGRREEEGSGRRWGVTVRGKPLKFAKKKAKGDKERVYPFLP